MSFGVGTGVNLGSATGYLFLDPRQFTRGLAQTASQVDRFYKATANRANAAARATQSGIRAVQAETALITQSHGELNRLRQVASRSAQDFARTSVTSSAQASAALTKLERDYASLGASRRRTFAEFGRGIQQRVSSVEAAEAREVASLRRLQQVRDANARKLPQVTAIADDAKRMAALERLTRAEEVAARQAAAATSRRITSERNLTAAIEGEVNRRTTAYQRDVRALRAAEAEMALARRQTQAKLASQIAGAATKTFLATGLAIGVSTAAFVSFEQSMKNVQSISGDTDEAIAGFTERVRSLSVALGISPTELAEGLYEIAQAGFDGAASMTILDTASRAAVAGLTDVETAAKPLIAIINAYQLSVDDAAAVSDKLFAGVTKGIFTFEELSTQIGDNVPLAAQLKVTLDDLIGSYIALTKQGNALSETTTQINGIFRAFLKPTEELTAVLHDLGFESGSDAIEFLGLANTLDAVADAVGDNDEALTDMFPLIRGLRGTVGLTGDQFREYASDIREVEESTLGLGDTQEVLAVQMESTAFQLRRSREQVRGAIIDFGEGLAPAIRTAADTVASLAHAFSNLSPEMQTTISHATLFVFGLSGIAVVAAKLVSTFFTLRDAVRAFNATLLTTRSLLITSGIGLALVAIGILAERYFRAKAAAEEVNQAIEDQKKAIADLNSGYEQLGETITHLRLIDLEAQADIATEGLARAQMTAMTVNKTFQDLDKQIADAQQRVVEFDKDFDVLNATDIERKAREGLVSVVNRLISRQQALGNANEVTARAVEVLNKAANDQFVNFEGVSKAVDGLLKGYRTGMILAPQVVEGLQFINENLELWEEQEDDATEAAEAQAQAVEELIGTIDDLTQSTLEAISGQKDFVSWLDGVQGGLAKADESAAKLINRMIRQAKGGILSGVDDDIRRAVELQRALERVDAAIARTEDSIESNSDDMSMWSGRIDLVTDTLGGDTDVLDEWFGMLDRGEVTQQQFNDAMDAGLITFEKLDALHNQGLLTDKEYNDVREAGIFLIERSVGGLRDERIEQALLLPLLAEYVRKHDEADGAIRNATEAQKEFIAAMNSSQAQTFLQTLQILAYLAAIGAIPVEKVTQFIADSADADPIIAGIVEDLGLIGEGTTAKIDVEAGGAFVGPDGQIHLPSFFDAPDTSEVDTVIEQLSTSQVIIPTNVQGAPGGQVAPTSVSPGGAALPPTTIPESDTRSITVDVDIEIDDEGKDSLDDIYKKINDWTDSVATVFTFTGGMSGTGRAAGGESTGFQQTVSSLNDWPENVSTSFEFSGTEGNPFGAITNSGKAATANMQLIAAAMQTIFVKIATDATNLGLAAGSGFRSQLVGELSRALNTASSIAGSIQATMNFSLFGQGLSAGGSFVTGFALALAGGAVVAFAGAYAIGAAAAAGVRAAIESGSPSRVAIGEGENFANSLIEGMRSRELDVAQQAMALGTAMRTGIAEGAFDRSGIIASINPSSQNVLLGQTFLPSHAMTNIAVRQEVIVPAADFPEWIRTMEYVQRLDQGFSTTLATKRGR